MFFFFLLARKRVNLSIQFFRSFLLRFKMTLTRTIHPIWFSIESKWDRRSFNRAIFLALSFSLWRHWLVLLWLSPLCKIENKTRIKCDERKTIIINTLNTHTTNLVDFGWNPFYFILIQKKFRLSTAHICHNVCALSLFHFGLSATSFSRYIIHFPLLASVIVCMNACWWVSNILQWTSFANDTNDMIRIHVHDL